MTGPRDFAAAGTAGATTLWTDTTALGAGARDFATVDTTDAAPAPEAAGLAAEPVADAAVAVAGATDFVSVHPVGAASPPPEDGGLAAAGEFCAGAETAVGSA
jgi:hypothetical protein